MSNQPTRPLRPGPSRTFRALAECMGLPEESAGTVLGPYLEFVDASPSTVTPGHLRDLEDALYRLQSILVPAGERPAKRALLEELLRAPNPPVS